jgi:cytochrome c-type biogenesis protein CcmE
MNKYHKRRLWLISLFAAGMTLAVGLVLFALKQNINVFLTPAQIAVNAPKSDYHFRLGGMVKKGSLIRHPQDLTVEFIVTDLKKELAVQYTGVLPDLFREDSGVIAEGSLNQHGVFIATQILAKHDENYMPKNVYEAMRKQDEKIT